MARAISAPRQDFSSIAKKFRYAHPGVASLGADLRVDSRAESRDIIQEHGTDRGAGTRGAYSGAGSRSRILKQNLGAGFRGGWNQGQDRGAVSRVGVDGDLQ